MKETTKQTHTKLPWMVSEADPCRVLVGNGVIVDEDQGDDVCIARTDGDTFDDLTDGAPQANADFIVRAVNSHDALLAACQASLAHIEASAAQNQCSGCFEAAAQMRAAIARATS